MMRALVVVGALAMAATATMSSEAVSQERGRRLAPAEPVELDDETSASALISGKQFLKMPKRQRAAAASTNDMSRREFRTLLASDPSVFIDPDGRIVFVDSFDQGATDQGATELSRGAIREFHAMLVDQPALMWPTAHTFGLHSNPDAEKIIYLDFDGEPSGNANPDAPPWNAEGTAADLTEGEHAHIQAVWQEVADDFAAFDIDVTTERPLSLGLAPGIKHVIFAFSNDYHDAYCGIGWCAGAAQLNGSISRVFARPSTSAHKNAAAAAHELGHNYGLTHDTWDQPGYPGSSYKGHGNWAPTMGGPLGRGITHFATGDYGPDPLNPEDDVAIITAGIGGLRPDDHADSGDWANATQLAAASTTITGVIESRVDTDSFTYAVPCAGTVEIDATVPTHGPNLDIELSIFDVTNGGPALVTADPPTATDIEYPPTGLAASASVVAAAGESLAFVIDGVGAYIEGVNGYSDYSSLGGYSVTVNTACDVAGETAPALAITSPAGGTNLDSATAAVVGNVTGAPTASVSVSFVEASGSTQLVTVPVDVDGGWEATIPVSPGEVWNVTAMAPDASTPVATATTSFSIWQEPQGAPAFISMVQPDRNAEVATPVRLAGIVYDNVGLGAPRLTIQHPDGRYWNGTAFVVGRVDLAVDAAASDETDHAWQYVFDPGSPDIASGSYTARIEAGRAVVGNAEYTTFRLGNDVTPPILASVSRPSTGSPILEWHVADDHALGEIVLTISDDNGVVSTEPIALSGYDATAAYDTSTAAGPGPHTVSGQLIDAAGNAVDLPTLTRPGFGSEFKMIITPPGPIDTQEWTLTGTNELNDGSPGLELAFAEVLTSAATDVGTMRWHPVWGWYPGGSSSSFYPFGGAALGADWSTDMQSFGSHRHTFFVDGTNRFGINGRVLGGFDFLQQDVDLNEFDLDIRAHLGGAYDHTSDLMTDQLRAFGILPATDPYVGTASVAADVLATTGIRAPVDWVLVELRPTGDPAGGLTQLPALVLRDGSIVAVDGYSPLRAEVATGEYYLTLTHRNHLPVTIRVDLGPRADMYIDLGQSSQSAIGGVGAHQLCDASGPCRAHGGNGARGGFDLYEVNGADKTVWFDVNGVFGTYEVGDYNLSGDVTGGDKIVWFESNGLFAMPPPW